MQIEIQTCPSGRLEQFARAAHTAFGEELPRADLPLFERVLEPDRLLCALDGREIVGTAAAYSFVLTVPGKEIPAAGVSWVGVLPSHRRQGVLRSMMRRQLDDVRERGEPLAILFASEGAIYQRFGYGLATLSVSFDVERSRSAFRTPDRPMGRTHLLSPEEATRDLPPVYDAVRRRQPGMLSRTPAWWAAEVIADPEHRRNGAGPKFFALHEIGGAPEGYAIYRIRQAWSQGSATSTLIAREVVAATPGAARALWQYLFGVDLVERIRGDMVVPDLSLLLQLAEPRRLNLAVGDGLWLRVVDLPAALTGRSYGTAGTLVFDVRDEFCPWNAGRWQLTVDGADAVVERSSREPDLECEIGDLGAAYLGGISFAQLGRALRVVERRPGAVEQADRMFRADRAPWCPQVF